MIVQFLAPEIAHRAAVRREMERHGFPLVDIEAEVERQRRRQCATSGQYVKIPTSTTKAATCPMCGRRVAFATAPKRQNDYWLNRFPTHSVGEPKGVR